MRYIIHLWTEGSWKVRTLLVMGIVALIASMSGATVLGIYFIRAAEYNLDIVTNPPTGVTVYDASGDQVGTLFSVNRELVDRKQVPDHLVAAVLATEDARFYRHPGVDLKGIARAFVVNLLQGEIEQGGSTVTQQLARQVYGLSGKTLDRKMLEAMLAIRIELRFSKEEILMAYMNWIYLGGQNHGFGAAAEYYYGKEIEQLTPADSAMLAALIKSPNGYSPLLHPERAEQQRAHTIKRMEVLDLVSLWDAQTLKRKPLGVVSADDRPRSHPYLLDHVRRELLARFDEQLLEKVSWKVETSLNADLQRKVKRSVRERIQRMEDQTERSEVNPLQGAALIIDNRSGEILASVGGVDFSSSQYNRAVQAKRRVGTAFLPLTYVAAFDSEALDPWSQVLDAPMDNRRVMIGGETGLLGEWGAESKKNQYFGPITAAGALLWGKNAATVRAGWKGGVDQLQKVAVNSGITTPLRPYSNAFLGSSELSLMEMVRAYSIFPNHGVPAPELHFIRRVIDDAGNEIYRAEIGTSEPAVKAEAAEQVHLVLWGGMRKGSSSRYLRSDDSLWLKNEFAVGKSGTTHDFANAWYLGYDGITTCGVWIGRDRPAPIGKAAFGHRVAMPLWIDVMNAAVDVGRPANKVVVHATADDSERLCLYSGFSATEHCHGKGPNRAEIDFGLPMLIDNQMVKQKCQLHSNGGGSATAGVPEVPRPSSREVEPIEAQGPIIEGSQPYLPMNEVQDGEDSLARNESLNYKPETE